MSVVKVVIVGGGEPSEQIQAVEPSREKSKLTSERQRRLIKSEACTFMGMDNKLISLQSIMVMQFSTCPLTYIDFTHRANRLLRA